MTFRPEENSAPNQTTPEQLDGMSPDQLATIAGPALERLERGFLPPAVFMPIRELVRMSTLEIVGFQAGTNGERVLIGHRGNESGDRWWSGMMNLPGSVMLPTEALEPWEPKMADGRPVSLGNTSYSVDITTPVDRILHTEFNGSIERVAPVRELLRYWTSNGVNKIAENKVEVWTEVDFAPGFDEVLGGAFYDTAEIIEDPPENLVNGHEYFIELGMLAGPDRIIAHLQQCSE